MDALQRKMLKSILKNLENSTRTEWESGDLAKWADYARSMRKSIRESISLINTLIEDDEKDHKQEGFKIETRGCLLASSITS